MAARSGRAAVTGDGGLAPYWQHADQVRGRRPPSTDDANREQPFKKKRRKRNAARGLSFVAEYRHPYLATPRGTE